MASLALESRPLIAAGGELLEDLPVALPVPVPLPHRRRARHGWTLGIVLAGVVGGSVLGGIAARAGKGAAVSLEDAPPSTQTLADGTEGSVGAVPETKVAGKKSAIVESFQIHFNNIGTPPALTNFSVPKDADADIQELVNNFKWSPWIVQQTQWWDFGIEPFKALSYCSQSAAGTSYVVKVRVDGGNRVLQLLIFKPLPVGGEGAEATLAAASVVAADDTSCPAPPLQTSVPLLHQVQKASSRIQLLIEAVKGKVPLLLSISGWSHVRLGEYKALSFCTDGMDYLVKVEVAPMGEQEERDQHPGGLYLQLLIREPSAVERAKTQLFGAMMVTPIFGTTCASVPVLPQPKPVELTDLEVMTGLEKPVKFLAPPLPPVEVPEVKAPAAGRAIDESAEKEETQTEPHVEKKTETEAEERTEKGKETERVTETRPEPDAKKQTEDRKDEGRAAAQEVEDEEADDEEKKGRAAARKGEDRDMGDEKDEGRAPAQKAEDEEKGEEKHEGQAPPAQKVEDDEKDREEDAGQAAAQEDEDEKKGEEKHEGQAPPAQKVQDEEKDKEEDAGQSAAQEDEEKDKEEDAGQAAVREDEDEEKDGASLQSTTLPEPHEATPPELAKPATKSIALPEKEPVKPEAAAKADEKIEESAAKHDDMTEGSKSAAGEGAARLSKKGYEAGMPRAMHV